MGSESSKSSDSNSSKSDSDSSSNSGNKSGKLEIMNFLNENDNTIIYRVWIVKKSITVNDRHVNYDFSLDPIMRIAQTVFLLKNNVEKLEIVKPKVNIFKIKNECRWYFKHWAMILELSNGSFVNIQFGREGFSLKEFNKTETDGKNLLDSILDTWGEEEHPFSFCYLGNAFYEYNKLKQQLEKLKDKESKRFEEKGRVYYNLLHNNCQHFVCDIEKILFGKMKENHSFDYYLDEFYNKFFPNVDMDKLKSKYEKELNEKNVELFKQNINRIKEHSKAGMYKLKSKYENEFNTLYNLKRKKIEKNCFKEIRKIEDLFGFKCTDYIT